MTIATRIEGGAAYVSVAGEAALCDPAGALFLPAHGLLVVSDLHLEKGAAFARRGVMMPPYDTAATLDRLARVVEAYDPAAVISLGDSFHDVVGARHMPEPFRQRLGAIMSGRDWFWIVGNHDPEPPAGLPGRTVSEIAVGNLLFRHEPAARACDGEVAGHLHPGARIVRRGRSVRRPCFATDGRRLVMPAFGALTGVLNVRDRAFLRLFEWNAFRAYMLGTGKVYPVDGKMLSPG
ncbi:ligase-associated DNA damage response endonuclease PdeM [Aquibium carbonis]|uniref:Ligase-associated DNA damage response endonuclease PdeM n=1 Tax=Aquibium carbonis TaxID=2495581 RepID=A0A429YZT7_9HYPH|nr:ligase-associated DNA damage response endonuclease PdeM [Aquibium carbonis]RST86914.1 ligase-associated DNA damage response endonuclease PdeM [Aquibium carbonis]